MATDKPAKEPPMSAKRKSTTQASSQKKPSRSEQRVLDEYFKTASPTAVARILGVNERTVRRVRDRFMDRLEERWAQRDAEEQAREDARFARVQDWIDEGLERAMETIDELQESANQSIRLQAAKVRIGLALRRPARAVARTSSELSELTLGHLAELERQLPEGSLTTTLPRIGGSP